MEELISVVIPAYNIEKYIAKTLDSVLAQTHQNLQIIVVNDGSKDNTGKILDEYARKDSRIKVIHKENGGVTSARLRGIAEAQGQYIGFVDGDDYIEPQMYERLLENMLAHQGDISHCGYQMVFPNGRIDYYHNTGKTVIEKGDQGCADLLDGRFVEPALVNKLYRTDLFRGLAEWIDTSVHFNEDLLMNFYLFRQAKTAVFEDVCFYHYVLRRGSAATSGRNEHAFKDPLRVQQILERQTRENPLWNRVAHRRLMYQLVSSATMSVGQYKEIIKPLRKEARKELRRNLWKTLKGNSCGFKLKVMVLWVAIWPDSYGWIHRLYAKITGGDRKYAVE